MAEQFRTLAYQTRRPVYSEQNIGYRCGPHRQVPLYFVDEQDLFVCLFVLFLLVQ
jgi:hypothetical protein